MAILKIRDNNGNITEIPAIKGDTGATGKSAYAYAKDGGYTGTEEEFEKAIADLAGESIPEYWLEELETKADAIQTAMEKAGRNKSAFLWYTDAHWANCNGKKSPMLLKYLYKNTPMNKVSFGGDIVGSSLLSTREEMKYLYEWRKAIKGLPSHHSVIGNHDNLSDETADYEDDNYRYAFLIAPEESSDMVMGGDFYYYIDNPCEKTRYLYLDSGKYTFTDDETEFIIGALASTKSGWHIVVISHIWWAYSSVSTPTEGNIATYPKKALDLFDAYNARQSGSITMVSVEKSYDFSSCGGKVEFCIGGHIHADFDIYSDGGIPIINTTSAANQNRNNTNQDFGELGTINESAVFGIIADYNSEVTKITVVGVGRGTSRVVYQRVEEQVINLFNKDDTDVVDTGRFNSSKAVVNYAAGQLVTGYIEATVGETITVTADKVQNTNGYTGQVMCYDASKNPIQNIAFSGTPWHWDDEHLSGTITIPTKYGGNSLAGTVWVRFCVAYTEIDSIVIAKS